MWNTRKTHQSIDIVQRAYSWASNREKIDPRSTRYSSVLRRMKQPSKIPCLFFLIILFYVWRGFIATQMGVLCLSEMCLTNSSNAMVSFFFTWITSDPVDKWIANVFSDVIRPAVALVWQWWKIKVSRINLFYIDPLEVCCYWMPSYRFEWKLKVNDDKCSSSMYVYDDRRTRTTETHWNWKRKWKLECSFSMNRCQVWLKWQIQIENCYMISDGMEKRLWHFVRHIFFLVKDAPTTVHNDKNQ